MPGRFLLGRDKALLATLGLLFMSHSTFLRVTLRAALEGPSFGWGYFNGLKANGAVAQVSGHGFQGDAGYLLAQAFIVTLLLVLGTRRPDGIWRLALLTWTSITLGLSIWVIGFSSETITVSKETLGMINVPAGMSLLLWPGLAWLAALLLVLRSAWRPAPVIAAPWSAMNTGLMLLAGLTLVGAGLLLNLGAQHGGADFMGIGLIYIALVLGFAGLCPWERPEAR